LFHIAFDLLVIFLGMFRWKIVYFWIKFDRNVKQIRNLKRKKKLFFFCECVAIIFPYLHVLPFVQHISSLMSHTEFLFSELKILPLFFFFLCVCVLIS
jgi:hypothetical protein